MVGVDPLFRRPGPGGNHVWCHLVCDDFSEAGLEELHRFAAELGIPRRRLHDPPGKPRPHYDLTPDLRERALALGARDLSRRELVAWLERGRQKIRKVLATEP
ncbi:MAG: DUF4031 domain-containing protein [Candidatus Eremiobacterota bacterium]